MNCLVRPRPGVAANAFLFLCLGWASVFCAGPASLHAQATVLSEMSPSSGNAGTVVIITGENFGTRKGASTVTFGGVAATIRQWSDSKVVVAVPAGVAAGPAEVVVTIANLKEDYPGTFAVMQAGVAEPAQGTVAAGQAPAPAVTPRTNRGNARKLTVALGDPPARPGGEKRPVTAAATAGAKAEVAANAGGAGADPTAGGIAGESDPAVVAQAAPPPAAPGKGEKPKTNTQQAPTPGANEPASNGAPGDDNGKAEAPATTPTITSVTPKTGTAGTEVTIEGTNLGDNADGKSTVKLGDAVATVAPGDWTPTKITATVKDVSVEPELVGVYVLDGTGKLLASSESTFTVNPQWGDLDERPLDISFVGGYEEGFQSSQASTSDGFLAFYGRRLFANDRFGPYFGARLQTAPQASGTYSVVSVLQNPTGAVTSTNLNSVGAAVDLSIGTEWQFKKGIDYNRTSLSFIAGTGFITPLQSNTIAATFNMPLFGTVECTELQGRLANVLAGPNYAGIKAVTTANSTGTTPCFNNAISSSTAPTAITLLEYAVPDTPNFYPKYQFGLRIVNRYPGTSGGAESCVPASKCERGYVDFTVGRSAALTGGILQHGVFTIDAIHPLPVPNMNYIYLFGSASKRFGSLPATVSPLVLTSATTTATTGPNPATLVIPLTQPDRDFYRIGVGVNITQIFSALAGKSNQTAGATNVAAKPAAKNSKSKPAPGGGTSGAQ